MGRECYFSGKRTMSGGSIRRRGLAKKFGGVGSRIIAHNKRKFKPNLQKVRCIVDGTPKRIWVAASEIKAGKVVRRSKRNWKPETPEAAEESKPEAGEE